jgi:hypothetical protein
MIDEYKESVPLLRAMLAGALLAMPFWLLVAGLYVWLT